MKFTTILLACTVLLVNCKKEDTSEQPGDDFLEEGHCLTNVNGQSNVSICFDNLEGDSRCPLNVQCVWSGVAVANFTLKTGTATIKFKLADYKTHLAGCPNDTIINNLHITLKDVVPYPGEAGYSLKPKKVKLEIL